MEIYRTKQTHGLEIIGISEDKSREAVLRYVEENGIEWPPGNRSRKRDQANGDIPHKRDSSYVWVGPDGVVIDPELIGALDDLHDAF